jgi:hypothetical protein
MPTNLGRLRTIFAIAALTLSQSSVGPPAVADEPRPADGSVPVTPALDGPQQARVAKLFDQLGAQEFKLRERAASQLNELGIEIVEELQRLTELSTDPEVRMRANQVIQQLSDGDQASKIKAFLAGNEVDFPGWRVVQAILGDNSGIRELFLGLMQEHPSLVASLQGTTRDRVLALERTISTVEGKARQLQPSNQADAFALLLPTIDPNLPIGNRFEPVALDVLRKEAATKIRNDAQLSVPFRNLLTQWIARGEHDNVDEVLLFSMQWDLNIGLVLAVRTLQQPYPIETHATALQTVARFGGPNQIKYVTPMLDNQGIVVEQGFVQGQEVQTLLGDVAMATIARLSGVDLPELGWPRSADHPTFSFLTSDIGFPRDEPNARKTARQKIDDLIQDSSAADPRDGND